MNLSIRELNELIYSLGIAAHHGNFVNKEINESLLDKIYSELDKKIVEQEAEEDVNYLISLDSTLKNVLGDANPLVDEIRSHFVSNEEADENARTNSIELPIGFGTKEFNDMCASYFGGQPSKKERGWIVQKMLDYVDYCGEVSHTQLENYYKAITKSNSFSHCLINLIVPYKNRKTQRYLVKKGKKGSNAKYVVRVAGLHNWVEKDY